MHVQRLLVRGTARAQQGINEIRKSIRLADDDVGVFGEFLVVELARKQLCRAANSAERVLDLVGELPDHLPAGAVLDQQRIFPADLRSPRDVGKLDEQGGRGAIERRYPTVDDALVRLDFVRAQAQLVRVVIARRTDAAEDVAQFRVVVQKPQERFPARAPLAYAENIFRGGIEADDEQVPVQQDDAGTQAVEDGLGLIADITAVIGTLLTCRLAAG